MNISLSYSDLCAIAAQVKKSQFEKLDSFHAQVVVYLHGIRFKVCGYYHKEEFEASYIVCMPKKYEMDCEYENGTFEFAFESKKVSVA